MKQWSDGSSVEVERMGTYFFKGQRCARPGGKEQMGAFIPYIIGLFLGRMGFMPP